MSGLLLDDPAHLLVRDERGCGDGAEGFPGGVSGTDRVVEALPRRGRNGWGQ